MRASSHVRNAEMSVPVRNWPLSGAKLNLQRGEQVMRFERGPSEARLAHRQEAAIASLLSCSNLAEAAAASRISERTLRRWMRNRNFATRYERERGKMLVGIVDVLKQECLGAVRVLVTIAHNGKSPAASRVSAASRIIDLTLKTGEMQALEKRVAELEQLAEGRK
jgi:hypothetical protein